LASWLRDWVHNHFFEPNGLVGHLLNIFAITAAAQILTLPIVAYHFEQVALISLVANLIVVPVQPLLMMIGVLATLLGGAFLPLGQLVGWLAWLLLTFTVRAVELMAQIPFATVSVEVNEFSLIFVYAVIAAVTWYLDQEVERRAETRQRLRLNLSQPVMGSVGLIGMLLAMSWSSGQPDGLLHVTFIDVDQGDAIFIETPTGRQILIDGGKFPTLLNGEIGRKLPFWDREIDLVIATHPDADHVTGLPELFDRYQVQQFIYDGQRAAISGVYGAVWERIEAQQIETHVAQSGEIIAVGDGVRLEILHPSGTLDEDIRNNNSVSLRLVYGEFSMLLTGDAEIEAERAMLETGLPLAAVVYKAGHHGSQTSSSAEFLNAINPQIVIISAGVDNPFGHPHPDVIARFNAIGAAVLDTRLQGTIEVKTDGKQMWWFGHRKAENREP
jgi:competence protein ComEC